jgi:LSD1 subclass zinc finger protein
MRRGKPAPEYGPVAICPGCHKPPRYLNGALKDRCICGAVQNHRAAKTLPR